MKSAPHYLIDKYLRDELTKNELSIFESELANNPEFASQVSSDQLIANGISQLRKAELKNRLAGVSIGDGWLGLGQSANSTLIKSLSVLLAGSVALGVYLMVDQDLTIDNTVKNTSLSISSGEIIYPLLTPMPRIVIPPRDEVKSRQSVKPASNTLDNAIGQITEELSTKTGVFVDESTDVNSEETFTLLVNVPDVGDLQDEKSLSVADAILPEISINDELDLKGNGSIDVETVYKKNSTIKYKYFDGKLYLFGDFKSSPYELLEINGNKTKRLYLFHDNQYYDISISEKIQELILIENTLQIEELEIIRNNKH